MFGYTKAYDELLSESGLESLKDRRSAAIMRFAQKTQENSNYTHLFPIHQTMRESLRHERKFCESFARTQRLYNSPLFTMRRLLNNTPNDPPDTELDLDLTHLFNQP